MIGQLGGRVVLALPEEGSGVVLLDYESGAVANAGATLGDAIRTQLAPA